MTGRVAIGARPPTRRARWGMAWKAALDILRGQPAAAVLLGGRYDLTADVTLHGSVLFGVGELNLDGCNLDGDLENYVWWDEQPDGSWVLRDPSGTARNAEQS